MQSYEKLYIFEIEGILDDPKFPCDFLGCWVEGNYSFLFFSSERGTEVEQFLSDRPESLRAKTIVDYTDWEAGRRVTHLRVGRILVCPLWDVVPPEPGDVRVLLDPGVAFGTGWHPTTNACLEILQSLFDADPPRTVLDLGTGTGILSIASVLLGAESALAIDNNQLSLTNAKKNIRINDVDDRVKLHYGNVLGCAARPADLVTANLYYDIIKQLLDVPELLQHPRILFSGLLNEFADAFLERADTLGMCVLQSREEKNWHTFLVENRKT